MLSLRSGLTQSLLLFFFINPFEEIYLHELARTLKVKPQNLHKKLKELEEIGLFKSKINGKERYYSLNCEWPLHRDYRNLIKKTIGAPHVIAEELKTIRYLKGVYVKIRAPFEMQKEIEVTILKSYSGYSQPSEKAISKSIKSLEKELEQKIIFRSTVEPPAAENYLKVL